MIRAAVRELRAHTARVVLTVLTIAFGVAFVVGSWVVGDSVQRGRTGVDLRSDFDVQAYQGDRPALGDRDVAAVAALPGVASAVGVIRGPAAVLSRGGKVVGSGDYGGTSWN
ncbi:MAG TPA: ABC transporter permease, partial [Catenuloplanes sp.]